jgi:hypothetical protein
VEPRQRSYGLMDITRIDLSFQFPGVELVEGDEIHAVFSRGDSSADHPQAVIRLEGGVTRSRITPDEISETEVYTARVEGRGTPDLEPGEYVCEEVVIQDEEGRHGPFTDNAGLDLVIRIREQPSYAAWVQGSKFVFDSQG